MGQVVWYEDKWGDLLDILYVSNRGEGGKYIYYLYVLDEDTQSIQSGMEEEVLVIQSIVAGRRQPQISGSHWSILLLP